MDTNGHHQFERANEGGGERPRNVGILAMEVYFPSTFVDQVDLENENGVSAGKYTIGLGQNGMAFTGDREDINSISLTALAGLLEKYDIDCKTIGRLEVGTETLLDKSKSTKTVLMSLFGANTDIEGVTTINACYGGTAAFLNSIAWVESSIWDGRYAIVVTADIAVYAEGPARPTGGCGAVAVLIGPDAPLAVNSRCRTSHATNVWDFFKPDMDSEYPRVDGVLSQSCYLRAIDDCYSRFAQKKILTTGVQSYTSNSADHFLFHSPYNKLVQKSYARLFYNDAKFFYDSGRELPAHLSTLQPWMNVPIEDTYTDRGLETALKHIAAPSYKTQVAPGCCLSQDIGNTYTASVFANIACLVDSMGSNLLNNRVVVFSYGSGSVATMYELIGRDTDSPFTLERMSKTLQIKSRLADREKLHPTELNAALTARAAAHGKTSFIPSYPINRLFPKTFYLSEVAENGIREYLRVPDFINRTKGGPLKPQDNVKVCNLNKDLSAIKIDSIMRPAVVVGIACGLPGQENVFEPDNLERLLGGQSCIFPLDSTNISSLLEKNVVQITKNPPARIPVLNDDQTIRVAARLGNIDLTQYGVTASIAATMDKAVQVAVAAGLEALRDSGIVKGGCNPEDWRLPESMQDNTGIVYATSYPAMDAAIGEVMRFLRSRCVTRAHKGRLVAALRERLRAHGQISTADEESLRSLEHAVITKSSVDLLSQDCDKDSEVDDDTYEFDRKFLFRVLVLGNAQLAQIIGARGPNMQTNAACAGSTQAVAMAQDMLSLGRATRIIVIAGDDASGDALLPWIGNGFLALGAASISADPIQASRPFDCMRNGMILGSGAIGMVLETESSVVNRPLGYQRCAKLLETQISNSARHGASMDLVHIASEMEVFLKTVELRHGITRKDIAEHGVYFSHETGTHASPTASCAFNEVSALRQCFGSLLEKLTIINTKGFTGHPMGVSFEDVAAVEVLRKKILPPTANTIDVDPILGILKLSRGGPFNAKYAFRFAAGFGSQVAFALYSAVDA